MSELTFNQKLGRTIRSGTSARLGTPTDELLAEAIAAGDHDAAARLLDYLVGEAGRIFSVLVTWLESQLEYGRRRVPDWSERVAALERTIGAPPPLTPVGDIAADEAEAARRTLARGALGAWPHALRRLREAQWKTHDELTDWLWGLLTAFRDALGEDAMEDVLRATQERWLSARYAALPELSQRESFELAIEGMRGHFCGPDHSGRVDVTEDDEKWVMAFDPCGSGGRMRRGDMALGQTPRTESPFGFGVAERAHDWTWRKEGVCLYCAHCAVANEILPIEHLGAPMRVTDYPERPGDKCRWTIYKDQAAVPDRVYERVGKRRPQPVGEKPGGAS